MWLLLVILSGGAGDVMGDLSDCKDRGLVEAVDACMERKGWNADGTRRPQVTELGRFDTEQACNSERDRIGFEMAEAYPHEADFQIVCWLKKKAGI